MTAEERKQAEYNVRAFDRDVKLFTEKRDRARLSARKARWQRKADFAAYCRDNNREHLITPDVEIVAHCPRCGKPKAIFKSKTPANPDRLFAKCREHDEFQWL